MVKIKLKDFLKYMKSRKTVEANSNVFDMFHELAQEALKTTMEINNAYHTPEEIVMLFSKLTGKKVDKTFRLFPPFYSECGKNIIVGKNVFINSCCKFQDHGGVAIGDGSLIGHGVTIATLNHDIDPEKRASLHPAPVNIGKNVWIGSDSTILPGVRIGEGAIIGARSVVTKDIPARSIAVGSPCAVIKYIKGEKK